MIVKRPSEERGHADHGWLDTRHTFSFANYHDPRYSGFRDLVVINEDRVEPGRGFGMHSHRDMEILTYVIDGALAHRDSMGNGARIEAGEVQRMSAGTGVTHSEFNASSTEPLHFLQIWIEPSEEGLDPSYEQRRVRTDDAVGTLKLIAAPERDGGVTVHQDSQIFLGLLRAGDSVVHKLQRGRHGWVQVIDGDISVNDVDLAAGDGAAVSDEAELRLRAKTAAHFLLFDLA